MKRLLVLLLCAVMAFLAPVTAEAITASTTIADLLAASGAQKNLGNILAAYGADVTKSTKLSGIETIKFAALTEETTPTDADTDEGFPGYTGGSTPYTLFTDDVAALLTQDVFSGLKELTLGEAAGAAGAGTEAGLAADGDDTVCATNLTKLDLSSFTNGTLAAVDVTNCPLLTTLNISGMGSEATVEAAIKITFTGNSKLTTINAAGAGSKDLATVTFENLGEKGIPALSTLNLTNATLAEESAKLNVSSLAELSSLTVSGSNITELTVGQAADTEADPAVEAAACKKLTSLVASNLSSLTTINANGCTGLTTVDASSDAKLATLNLASCTGLTTLNVSKSGTGAKDAEDNDTGLNITFGKALVTFNAAGARLTADTLAALKTETKLTSVNLNGAKVLPAADDIPLDLSTLVAVVSVDVSESSITSLTVTGLPIVSLNASKCTELTTLNTTNCTSLETINVSGCTQLTSLSLNTLAALKTLNASGCKELAAIISANNSKLEVLNLSGCPKLSYVAPSTTYAGTVTMAGLTGMKYLNLSGTSATGNALVNTLDLTAATGMVSADMTNASELATVSAKELTSLKALILADCAKLADVNASFCTALETVDLTNATMASTAGLVSLAADANARIDLSGCTALKTLDLSDCTNLTRLYAPSAGLQTLLLPDSSKLASKFNLDVSHNALTKLDLSQTETNKGTYFVEGQTRYFPTASADAAMNFNTLFGFTAVDMSRVPSFVDQNGNEGTVSGTTVTFPAAPTAVYYNYRNFSDSTLSMDVAAIARDEGTTTGMTLNPTAISVTDAVVGTKIADQVVTASEAVTWTFSGTLPEELTVASTDTTLTISGTPSEEGTFSGSITATAVSDATTKTATWSIVVVNETPRVTVTGSTAEMTATVGSAVSRTFTASLTPEATGVTVTWTADPATAPAGLEYIPADMTGMTLVVSGEPDEITSGDITVSASATGYESANSLTFHYNFTGGTTGGSSSGGCDAGFGALAVAVLGLLGLKRK